MYNKKNYEIQKDSKDEILYFKEYVILKNTF
jgi:hypothetical protein